MQFDPGKWKKSETEFYFDRHQEGFYKQKFINLFETLHVAALKGKRTLKGNFFIF